MKILIAENIKRLRREKNVTQDQLAEAMNVTCAAVSKWERGDSCPDITLLQPLAYYFGVSVDELLGYDVIRVEKEADDILAKYSEISLKDSAAAKELITKAYFDYPNHYKIMHCYMWDIAGNYADNDPAVLLEHKEEFLGICQRIEDGCRDNYIRLDALNMRAKIMWAEGKVDDAIEIYRNNFSNWYQTSAQKCEQLFPKDDPEFLKWAHFNMCVLSYFSADKFAKTIFFDGAVPYEEKIEKVSHIGALLNELCEKSDEAFFAIIARGFLGRYTNDLRYRGGEEKDIAVIEEKYLKSREKLIELSKKDPRLESFIGNGYIC